MTEGITPPSRARFRADRERRRREIEDRRRRLMWAPAVVLGVAMIAVGAWKFLGGSDDVPTDVQGTSIERTSTIPSTTLIDDSTTLSSVDTDTADTNSDTTEVTIANAGDSIAVVGEAPSKTTADGAPSAGP